MVLLSQIVIAAAAESQLIGSCRRVEVKNWKGKNSLGFVWGMRTPRIKKNRWEFLIIFLMLS